MKKNKIKFAVIPVAGYGTRLLPISKSIPKEMVPIFDRPAIDLVAAEAFNAGIEHIIFITNRNKMAIEDYFDFSYEVEEELRAKGKNDLLKICENATPSPGRVSFIRQQKAKGLGNAIYCARHIIGDHDFCVLLPDVILEKREKIFKDMMDVYNKCGSYSLLVNEVEEEFVHQYGIIDYVKEGNEANRITGMVEKPKLEDAPSNLAITGRYILPGKIFKVLETVKKGSGGEIQLTDAIIKTLTEFNYQIYKLDGKIFDCGSRRGYLQAFINGALRTDQSLKKEILDILQDFE